MRKKAFPAGRGTDNTAEAVTGLKAACTQRKGGDSWLQNNTHQASRRGS